MSFRLEGEKGDMLRGEFDAGIVRRFIEAAGKLAAQGVSVYQRYTGTEMRLSVGRSGEDIIDIQAQIGQDVRQLFVTVVGDKQTFGLVYNHMHEGGFSPVDVDRFAKGALGSEERALLESEYPRGLLSLKFPIPGTVDDLIRVTEVLEQAVK